MSGPASAPPSAPSLQLYPGAQSAGVVQPLVQAAFVQACGVQFVVEPGRHFPAPSHFETPNKMAVPVMQPAAAQVVPDG